jgi:hypothetical protein
MTGWQALVAMSVVIRSGMAYARQPNVQPALLCEVAAGCAYREQSVWGWCAMESLDSNWSATTCWKDWLVRDEGIVTAFLTGNS